MPWVNAFLLAFGRVEQRRGGRWKWVGTVFRSGITNVVGVHINRAHAWMNSRMEYPDQGFTTQCGEPVACDVMERACACGEHVGGLRSQTEPAALPGLAWSGEGRPTSDAPWVDERMSGSCVGIQIKGEIELLCSVCNATWGHLRIRIAK